MRKSRRLQSLFLVLVMVLSLFSGMSMTAEAADPDYSGQTAVGSYRISTGAQLAELARQVNLGNTYEGSTFTLDGDIDLSQSSTSGTLTWTGGGEWIPVAPYTDQDGNPAGLYFAGTFDGNGHFIKNISVNQSTAYYEGYSLFGVVGTNSAIGIKGTVENLGTNRICIFVSLRRRDCRIQLWHDKSLL